MEKLQEHRICPICGKDNGCIIGNKDCWCTTFDFPEGLIEKVPVEKRGKVCICKDCALEYIEENKSK
ncbi:MAG TPA: cysteine-rich CWC family protein [Tissierellaceae bacterium]